MEQFEQYWPVGTKERLAYELIKHTGQRRSDIVRLGRQHEKDGWLIFTQHKGRNVNPQHIRIPIFPELREVIDASETGDLHYLVTDGPTLESNGDTSKLLPQKVSATSSVMPLGQPGSPAYQRMVCERPSQRNRLKRAVRRHKLLR